MCERGYVHTCAGCPRRMDAFHPWSWNYRQLSHLTWVLGTEPGPSRSASSLNRWACERIWKLLSTDVCCFCWISIPFAGPNVRSCVMLKGTGEAYVSSSVASLSSWGSPQMVFLWGIVIMTYSDLNLRLTPTWKPVLWEVFMCVVDSQLRSSLWELCELYMFCLCCVWQSFSSSLRFCVHCAGEPPHGGLELMSFCFHLSRSGRVGSIPPHLAIMLF